MRIEISPAEANEDIPARDRIRKFNDASDEAVNLSTPKNSKPYSPAGRRRLFPVDCSSQPNPCRIVCIDRASVLSSPAITSTSQVSNHPKVSRRLNFTRRQPHPNDQLPLLNTI